MDFVIFLTLQFFFLFLFSPTTSSAPLLVTTADPTYSFAATTLAKITHIYIVLLH